MRFSYIFIFALVGSLFPVRAVHAQDEMGCSAASLHAMVSWYQLAVLDEGVDEDPDGEIPEGEAIDSNYIKLSKALQKLHSLGMLGSNSAKMPEVILGDSAETLSDWSQLFGDSAMSVDDTLIAISGSEELQDVLDNSSQCREIVDICKRIASVKKPKKSSKAFKSKMKILQSFLKTKPLTALEATGEAYASDLSAAKAACSKAEKKIVGLVK